MKKELTFEQAIEKLSKINSEIESGNLSLDKSLELFKEGIVATINQRLDYDTASIIIDELGIKGVKLEKKNTATKRNRNTISNSLYFVWKVLD